MNLSTSHRAVYLLIFAFRMRIVILQSISILKSRVRTIFGKNYFVNKSCGLVLPVRFGFGIVKTFLTADIST